MAVFPAEAQRPTKPPRGKPAVLMPMDKEWHKTFSLIRAHADPVGAKLLTWIYVTETDLPIEAHQLMNFVNDNPDWPRLHVFKRKIENSLADGHDTKTILAWYDKHTPTTADGARGYIEALLRTGKKDAAKKFLAGFWQEARLTKHETATLAGRYKALFAAGRHVARLDSLIWDQRYSEAEYMLAFVDKSIRDIGQARIALGRTSRNANALLDALPASAQRTEGIVFERLRWRRRKATDESAMEMLAQMPAQLSHPDAWWGELNILMRRRLEKRDYKGAAAIIEKHQSKKGFAFAQAEWLLGWIKLQYLNDPVAAYRHFDGMYKNVGTAISLSRAAYWAARAAEKGQADGKVAKQWHRIAAQYPSTFYGQLSFEKVYGRPHKLTFRDPVISPAHLSAFSKNELVRALRLLQKLDLEKLYDPFFIRLIANAKEKEDYIMAAELAKEMKQYYYAVHANKECQQETGQFLFFEGFPTLHSLPSKKPEKALVHAIIYRESMFKLNALSHAGARGLMQLMPGTAKATARSIKTAYSRDRLTTDARYNVLIGSAHLEDLVDNYGGFYPMAIAAYNAGGGNVRKWIEAFGDPRKGDMDIVDWVEHIPIYETRNYVQRVMESYYIYRLRFGDPPKTIEDFIKPS